jgi:hypothetical protein
VAIILGCVAPTRSLQPNISAKVLAKVDLTERVVVNLRGRDMPAVVLRHNSNLLFLAVGRGSRAILGNLEIALALDSRGGWLA